MKPTYLPGPRETADEWAERRHRLLLDGADVFDCEVPRRLQVNANERIVLIAVLSLCEPIAALPKRKADESEDAYRLRVVRDGTVLARLLERLRALR